MTDEDCEIEYLDEDEEIIQQYVQPVPTTPIIKNVPVFEDIEEKITPLLVRRRTVEHKRKIEEDDSDYDPADDMQPFRKKKRFPVKKTPKIYTNIKSRTITLVPRYSIPAVVESNPEKVEKPAKKPAVTPDQVRRNNDLVKRKNMDIKIPDYEDPICLPVRAVKFDDNDAKKLKHWNNLCLEHFEKADTFLEPESGETVGSTRSIVLRNIQNKATGKYETNIWSKTIVENHSGEKKSEVFQCTLPRYREKKILPAYHLVKSRHREVNHSYEVVMTKEDYKDEEMLVVYKPKEAISAVYKVHGRKESEDMVDAGDEKGKMKLKEVACTKICAPCYQVSWRGVRKADNGKNMRCKICSITFVSVYNMLTHLKTHHSNAEVRKYKRHISKTLAEVVDYHYKCRICLELFLSIRELRKHVIKHRGNEIFKCEVGNHLAS